MSDDQATFGKVVVAVGTYDGVLAGWELDSQQRKFKISFATPVHEGSVRAITMAQPHADSNSSKSTKSPKETKDPQKILPGALLSCGYDEVLRTHDFSKRLNSAGEVRTPAELGTPVCSAFAPPMTLQWNDDDDESVSPVGSTHCLVGFAEGKLVIYKKRDWTVQHVLAGHEGGVACISVHPSGKMALTGGESDGKLKLWDLTKGRLAFVTKINPSQTKQGKTMYDAISNIVWASERDGQEAYVFCYGNHITVRDVGSGNDLLDVDLPSRVNQVCFLSGDAEEGLFVAAACNDGSLPVLAVENEDEGERRAIMAIEPVEGLVAGEERFKCIQALTHGHVVTANSAGVVSLMDLRGAIRMITTNANNDSDDDDENDGDSETGNAQEQASDDDEEQELAVEIIDGVQLGTGARVTCLAAWCSPATAQEDGSDLSDIEDEQETIQQDSSEKQEKSKKRSRPDENKVEIDNDALKRARALVATAKQIQSRKQKKKQKKTKRGKD